MKRLLFLAFLLILISSVSAIAMENVNYPVSELGGCENQAACEAYCNNVENIETCLNFAETKGLMSETEIAQARKVLPFLKAGTTPGKCKSEKECNEYCDKEKNLEECINFGISMGEISPKEAEMIKKTGGKGPGGCKRDECKTYCDDETHFSECIDFAIANGLMSPEEAEIAKKTGGKGPGNCKGKEECDSYCQSEEHIEECINFSIQYGMMDPKDAEMMRKTKGKGPGNCKGEQECKAFCDNPANQETCLNFAIENNLLSPEDLANMQKNQEFMNSDTGKCFTQCMHEAGVDSKECKEDGTGPEACQTCNENCFSHNNENCLNQEKWTQLNDNCNAKGSGYHLEEVRGSDGKGGECVVDETCIYSSGEEWESQAEKDRKLADMQKQWDEEKAKYESEHGPGSSTEGDSGGSSGGCTQPGPEGQCNPGPGAGSDSSGSSGGSGDSGTGSSSGEESSGGSASGESRDGDSSGTGITGAVIMKYNSENIFEKIVNLFK